MGKAGKRKGAAGAKTPSAIWLWALGATGAALLAHRAVNSRPATHEHAADEVDEFGGREEAVLSALFSHSGSRAGRFSDAEYWDERYAKMNLDAPYDWYGTWSTETSSRLVIRPHVKPWMPKQVDAILNLGCGNSRLPEELFADGYANIVNIDISQTAIDKMRTKFSGHHAIHFERMDMSEMTFDDASFDVVFDKGGLDAMYTGASSQVASAVSHVFRVLRPGGLFVSMTFGSPAKRSDLNATTGRAGDPAGWDGFETIWVDRPEGDLNDQQLYIYLMTKPIT